MWTVGTGFPDFQAHYYLGYLSIVLEIIPCSICGKNANPSQSCRWKLTHGRLWLIHDSCLSVLRDSPKTWAWNWDDP